VHTAIKVNIDFQQHRTESIESALYNVQARHVALTVALDLEREVQKDKEEAHQRTRAIIKDIPILADYLSGKSSTFIR
jgi:hypothetical protein